MTTTLFAGATALLLVLSLILRRRSPPPLLRSSDTRAIAALNRAQIALAASAAPRQEPAGPAVASPAPPTEPPLAGDGPAPVPLPAPADSRRRAELTARLQHQLHGDPRQRLQAMRTARRWGHPAVLPLLRRGLRDVDPSVVLEAVQGIERFRTCPHVAAARPQRPLPRNVSRTR